MNSPSPPPALDTTPTNNTEHTNTHSSQRPQASSAQRARHYARLRSKRLRANMWPLLLPIIIPMLFVIIIMVITGVLLFHHSPLWEMDQPSKVEQATHPVYSVAKQAPAALSEVLLQSRCPAV